MKYSITSKHNKSKFRPITNRAPVLLLCLVVFGFLTKAAWSAYLEKRRSTETAETARSELQKLEERNTFISEELDKLSTEEGREAKLREKFGVGRPGEQVAIIVEAENNNTDSEEKVNICAKFNDFFKSLLKK